MEIMMVNKPVKQASILKLEREVCVSVFLMSE